MYNSFEFRCITPNTKDEMMDNFEKQKPSFFEGSFPCKTQKLDFYTPLPSRKEIAKYKR